MAWLELMKLQLDTGEGHQKEEPEMEDAMARIEPSSTGTVVLRTCCELVIYSPACYSSPMQGVIGSLDTFHC